jgi:hypothetical protein
MTEPVICHNYINGEWRLGPDTPIASHNPAIVTLAEGYPVMQAGGQPVLFTGFLAAQAQQLFEMTRCKGKL